MTNSGRRLLNFLLRAFAFTRGTTAAWRWVLLSTLSSSPTPAPLFGAHADEAIHLCRNTRVRAAPVDAEMSGADP